MYTIYVFSPASGPIVVESIYDDKGTFYSAY